MLRLICASFSSIIKAALTIDRAYCLSKVNFNKMKNSWYIAMYIQVIGGGVMVNLLLSLILSALLMEENVVIKLPAPSTDSSFSVERAINERMSIRTYKDTPLTLKGVSHFR